LPFGFRRERRAWKTIRAGQDREIRQTMARGWDLFTGEVRKSESEWKKQLTPLQYDVDAPWATDSLFPVSSAINMRRGYTAASIATTHRVDSRAKFDSGTGWPSFWEAIAAENVREKKDFSAGVLRTKSKCTLCDAHSGMSSPDGPEPTGLRYA